jgi:hypothetical protein
MRLPKRSAVARSLGGGALSGPWSALLCDMSPRNEAKRFSSSALPALVCQPGSWPSVTQIIPCCAAKPASCCSESSLSPLMPAEFVNPAASLSFHRCSRNRGWSVSSMNALSSADPDPM